MREVRSYYEQFDEWGRLDREPVEFQVNLHYMRKHLPKSGTILDNGAGPGKYAIALAGSGYTVTVTDLTPGLVVQAEQHAKDAGVHASMDGFYTKDARDLSGFRDDTFDAALMLGPLYHLQEEADRRLAVQELARVTRMGGVIFVAFMPRTRHVLNALTNPHKWPPHDEFQAIKSFNETGMFNHAERGRFTGAYYYDIENIVPFMESFGFETKELIGSNVGTMITEEQWAYWRTRKEDREVTEWLIKEATNPYMLGSSSHLLYIGQKGGV
ncbi:class I SAM-dependent methyltransferase [Geomicrobium sp. JSM 1781026]|uniref:class I SAM-dependent methyltransferase n=1 Tax=Geomicrobium sp. JSM 1781026 TaxID=3344580 RepID=UPI0035C147C7